jgi:hypothetical protein
MPGRKWKKTKTLAALRLGVKGFGNAKMPGRKGKTKNFSGFAPSR